MRQNKKGIHGASIFGLLLIALGVIWVLSNLRVIDFRFSTWWPIIIIVLGIVNLLGGKKLNNPSGWIFVALGTLFLLATQGIYKWSEIWKFWPVILVILGFSILFSRGGRAADRQSDLDEINGSAIFASFEKNISNRNFKGGHLSAVFGNAELDLRSAGLDEEGAVIQVQATFGGVTLWVPESWPIETQVSAVLGGIENRTKNPEVKDGKRLTIKATATFGGIEIKN